MTSAYNVLKELSRRGHQITVLTTSIGANVPPVSTQMLDGMIVHYFRGYGEGLYLSHQLLRFLQNHWNHEIVHVCNYRNFPSDIVSLWSRRRGLPTIVSANGCLFAYRYVPAFSSLKLALYKLHDSFISSPIRKATLAMAVSSTEASDYMHFGVPRDRIRVVPNGVDLGIFCPGDPEGAHISKLAAGSKLIGYVGRLDPIKGLLTLVEAFDVLQRDVPEAKLVLVGPDFGMRKKINFLVDKKQLRGVVFWGVASQETLVQLYRAFDVVAIPSYFEIFGMSILEAMACGRPVVSTQVGGVSELIHDGSDGFLVPPRDSESLSRRIISILGNRDLALRMGQNARLTANNFGISRTADLTEKAYAECLSRSCP